MTDEDDPLSVDDLVDYCRTQAALLAGRVETIGEEADALLDEIDADIATARDRLSARSGGEASAATPPTPGPDESEVEDLEALESDLEEKQAAAEAKQARMAAFQDLSEAYADLAGGIDSDAEDWQAALDRVVEFERDHDAPAYFEDRQTLLEAAAEAGEE